MKVFFDPHLESINNAFVDYFKGDDSFEVLSKPKQNTLLKFFYFISLFFKFISQPCIVHVNTTKSGFIAYLSSFFGVRYIYTIHGYIIDPRHYKVNFVHRLDKFLMKLVHKRAVDTFTISKYSQNTLLSIYGISAKVIYNGYDPAEFNDIGRSVDNNFNFISVGRMNSVKDPFAVINIFKDIKKLKPKATLILIGDGPLYSDVLAYCSELEDESIKVIKHVSFESISGYYKKSDFFISGCREEKFGLVVLEAIACGCFPLLPYSSAFPELYKDSSFYYDGGVFLPDNDDKLKELKENLLPNFTWNKIIHQYEAIYKEVING